MIINVQSGRTERYKTSRGAGARRGGRGVADPAGWPDPAATGDPAAAAAASRRRHAITH